MSDIPKCSVVGSTYLSKLGRPEKTGMKTFNHALVNVTDIWCEGALQINGRLVVIPSNTSQIQDGT